MAARIVRYGLAWLGCTLAVPVAAQPVLDPLFGDGAVLQREQPIDIRGRASPGETVSATLGEATESATADRDGRFELAFAAMAAGGPYRLTVTAASGTASADDLLIGDVFLCSGQSNMELAVARAQDAGNQIAASNDPLLRLFTIERATALQPLRDLDKVSGWLRSSPDSAPGFSAACFYMAQDLRRSADVPIGAIHSSWGGSRISAWMGDDALKASGQRGAADLRALYARDSSAASVEAGYIWQDWWRKASSDAPGREPWQPDAALDWQPVPRIGYWEDWGVAELAAFNGMVWFRREVFLTSAQARQAATLAIGPVDDADQTWLNGKPVGSGGNPGKPRVYALAGGALRAGRNVITVNANDSYGKGGMPGPASIMQLALADGTVIPIGDGWEYAVEARTLPRPPRAPWEDTAGAGTIYNAMIAPLGRIGLKGVAWYQGESDVELPGYADRMAAMMAGWRQQFGVAELPFAIVQLANYGAHATSPTESGWAALREEQRQAVIADNRRAALALAIDLGDPVDIHPGQKREVGRRLARAMRAIAYGAGDPPSGPAIAAAERTTNGGALLTFNDVTGKLASRSSGIAIGFELCGPQPGSCRFAPGRVSGATVTLPGDGQPVARVRYAWADSPAINLFDAAGLPAGPFEIPLP
ncbi:sialate O-acetylesterase [Blastomonas sp.]|uniref:sialate O-acetylesterase n=1 Tax=Blastomonas sp. TaxID=1909299 RepID=UPI00260F6356|nr:sialate O-acetylesterase [Blastomonas sp.]MDM7955212.1 sialate O-acetylesterase [Blastomonas sp.]